MRQRMALIGRCSRCTKAPLPAPSGCLSGRIPIAGGGFTSAKKARADISLFPRKGGVVWVETKDPSGSTKKSRREAQHAFKSIVEALQHRYLVVKTIDEGMEVAAMSMGKFRFTKSTVQANCWCNKCGKETPWRIAGGKRSYCLRLLRQAARREKSRGPD